MEAENRYLFSNDSEEETCTRNTRELQNDSRNSWRRTTERERFAEARK
jgi:hypothetical protein